MNTTEIVQYVLKTRKGKKSPASYILASKHKASKPLLWFDKENNITRALRYAPNEQSIFEDEQSHNLVLEPIIFLDGKIDVLPHQIMLRTFLEHHPDNGTLFERFDPEAKAREKERRDDLEDDALAAWRDTTVDQKISLIRVLSDKKNPEKMSHSEIKVLSRELTKQNPEKVLNTLKDPEFDKQNIAEIAFTDGWLSKRKDGVYYNLKNNKSRAFVVPKDVDYKDETLAWFKTEEGMEVYTMIQRNQDK